MYMYIVLYIIMSYCETKLYDNFIEITHHELFQLFSSAFESWKYKIEKFYLIKSHSIGDLWDLKYWKIQLKL